MTTPKRILLVTIVISCLLLSVCAHPGKTDSSGGHYNRSTGDYHYHHGYPEHHHTNGICPYKYEDKTGAHSGSTSSSTKSASISRPSTPKQAASEKPTEKKKKSVGDIVGMIFAGLVLTLYLAPIIFGIVSGIYDAIKGLVQRHTSPAKTGGRNMKLLAKLKNTIGTGIFKKKKPGSTGGDTDDTVRELIISQGDGVVLDICPDCKQPRENGVCRLCEEKKKQEQEKRGQQGKQPLPNTPLVIQEKAEHKNPSLDEKIGGAESRRQQGTDIIPKALEQER